MAQQSAEKAIKAALVLEQVQFPFVHDLTALRNLLPTGWDVGVTDVDLDWLTQWAVVARYPQGATSRPADAARAIEIAHNVCAAVAGQLDHRGVA